MLKDLAFTRLKAVKTVFRPFSLTWRLVTTTVEVLVTMFVLITEFFREVRKVCQDGRGAKSEKARKKYRTTLAAAAAVAVSLLVAVSTFFLGAVNAATLADNVLVQFVHLVR